MTATPTPETITLHDAGFSLPPAVAASIARANDLIKTVGEPTTEATPPAQAEPAPVDPPAEPPVTEGVTAADNKPVDWEGRYKAMKGRHDKLQERVQQMEGDLSQLRHQLALRPTVPTAPAAPAAPFTVEDLTPEERSDYGEDLLNVVNKVAGRRVAEIATRFDEKIGQLEQKFSGVEQVAQMSAKEKFVESMTNRVPNWRDINEDPNFLDWCNQIDPYTGQPRLSLLREAYRLGDAPRAAAFFQGFLREANPSAAPQKETKSDPKVSLASLAAPGRARSTAPEPGPGDKPIIARSEVEQFYRDVQRGSFRGRDADRLAREAEIFAALNEGRVR